MMKLDPAARKETGFISLWVAIAIAPVQAAFVLLKEWDYTVLLGSVLGSIAAILNFVLMCLMVQKAVIQDRKQAKNTVQLSQGLRLLGQGLILVLAACLPMVFNLWATAIPLLVPRAAITVREAQPERLRSSDSRSNSLIDEEVDDLIDD